MEVVFLGLLFASLFLLILGLISPTTSLFWLKSNQTRGKSSLVYGLATILFFVLFGETATIKLNLIDLIDIHQPITLSKYNGNGIKQTVVAPGAEEYENFVRWIENNSSDWKSTSASFTPAVTISQDEFRLTYFREGFVVLNYIDNKGDGNQYRKMIDPGELDFILE